MLCKILNGSRLKKSRHATNQMYSRHFHSTKKSLVSHKEFLCFKTTANAYNIKMDILRSEFLKYDNSKSGTISTMDFKKVLGKFGVAKGAEVVIRKFRGCNINEIKYEDFIKYFESAKKNQSIQKSSYTYQNATALKPLESLHVQGEAQSEKKEPVKRTRERKVKQLCFHKS